MVDLLRPTQRTGPLGAPGGPGYGQRSQV